MQRNDIAPAVSFQIVAQKLWFSFRRSWPLAVANCRRPVLFLIFNKLSIDVSQPLLTKKNRLKVTFDGFLAIEDLSCNRVPLTTCHVRQANGWLRNY